MRHAFLVASLSLGLTAGLQGAQPTPRYTNAELVSLDPQTRLVVVKDSAGRRQTLELDATVAGLQGLRAGDQVILTLREEPGMTRISAIQKSLASTGVAPRPVVETPAPPTAPVSPALSAFATQVAALAQQATRVDALWNDFVTTCNVTLRSSYTDGRDWFSLWDGGAQVDLSAGSCRDLFNQVVGEGQTVKAGMAGAEEAARRADVAPGDMRDIRRRHSLEWGGWDLPAPEPQKQ
jgi:hypothetical protein